MADGDEEQDHSDGDVEEKDPTPRSRRDQITAQQRSDRSGHRTETCPRSDRRGPVTRSKRRLEDGEAPSDQEGTTDPLQHAHSDKEPGTRGEATSRGRDGEADYSDTEQPLSSEAVAERTAEEQERREGEKVTTHDPLEGGHTDVKFAADRRQGDTNHRGIDRRDPRAQDRRCDHPTPGRRTEPELPTWDQHLHSPAHAPPMAAEPITDSDQQSPTPVVPGDPAYASSRRASSPPRR